MSLSKYLPKKDAIVLLEFIYDLFDCFETNQLKKQLINLRELLSFDIPFISFWELKEDPKDNLLKFYLDPVDLGFPNEFMDIYISSGLSEIDEVSFEAYKKKKCVNWLEYSTRFPSREQTLLNNLANDFGLTDGFSCGAIDYTLLSGTSFSMGGKYIENNSRERTIIEYLAPHVDIAVRRIHEKRKCLIGNGLSSREVEVLKWLKEGKTSWEISKILKISERTINYHITNTKEKLNAGNRIHAVAIAIENGLLK